MNRILAAAALAALALLMLVGFFESGASLDAPATLGALALTVGLPAVGAALLVRGHLGERDRRAGRKARLREQTLAAEVLRLAGEHGGRLTAVEVATHLALTPEAAKEALDSLTLRGHADLQVTDAGVLVYSFHDVRHLGGKSSAKGLLE